VLRPRCRRSADGIYTRNRYCMSSTDGPIYRIACANRSRPWNDLAYIAAAARSRQQNNTKCVQRTYTTVLVVLTTMKRCDIHMKSSIAYTTIDRPVSLYDDRPRAVNPSFFVSRVQHTHASGIIRRNPLPISKLKLLKGRSPANMYICSAHDSSLSSQ